MKKFQIIVKEFDPFDGHVFYSKVVAYQDNCIEDILWYDSAYGIPCATTMEEHPEKEVI